MIRIICISSLLLLGYCSIAQHVVNKTSEIVVIRGVSYYLHTVEEGQTLYSICKAYGVDVEKIKELNDKADNTLSPFDVLKIPYTEPVGKQDPAYFYYTVRKGETLYSISRKFEIKVKRILQENKHLDEKIPLALESVIRLLKKDINMNVAQKAAEIQTPKEVKKIEVITASTPIQPKPTVDTTTHKTKKTAKITGDGSVSIALLMPFYAKEHQTYKLSSKSESFVYFYEGILMAVDSLKNRGYKIDLHVYDTEKSVEKSTRIAHEINALNPDLIIGPVYNTIFESVIANLDNKNIPVIYPLSSQKDDFDKHINFVQVHASNRTLVSKMCEWVAARSHTSNIIDIRLSDTKTDNESAAASEKKLFAEKLKNIPGIHYFNWNFAEDPLAAFGHLLQTDKENIIILPTNDEAVVSKILPAISVYSSSHRMTVLGLPKWQTFTTVDHDSYYKLNVKIFTYSYVDSYTPEAKQFSESYRRNFYTEPSPLANKSFDMGLYFIELAAKYKGHTLDAIEDTDKEGLFSTFRFSKSGAGLENKGFRIVTYGSDYNIKVETLE